MSSSRASALARALAAGVVLSLAAAIPARAQQQIPIGTTVNGTITSSDPTLGDQSHYKLYTFAGTAGQTVQIDMTSSDFDAYLILRDQSGAQIKTDDDSGGGLNARIIQTLGYTGLYQIVANTNRANQYGAFTLQLQAVGGGGAAPAQPVVTPIGPQPVGGSPSAGVVGTIGLNQQAQNTLTAGAARYDGKPFQAYSFQCAAGQAFQMDVISDWDNYAMVFDPSGNQVAHDDDSGGNLNARIQYTCPMNGTYLLAVSTYSATTTTGAYTLRVQASAPGAAVTAGVIGTIGLNQQVQNNLTPDAPRYNGKPFQAYNFACTAGQAFQMDVISTWDNYAIVFDPVGNPVATDDDSGGSLNARVQHTCQLTGTYRLAVSTYSASTTTGPYTMRVQALGMPTAIQQQPVTNPVPQPIGGAAGAPALVNNPIPPAGQTAQIAVGQTMRGRLEDGDQTMSDGTYADIWQFQVMVPQSVTVDVQSGEFATYIQLLDANGNLLSQDTHTAGGNNSRIVATLSAAGTYQVVVNSAGGQRVSGNYTVGVH